MKSEDSEKTDERGNNVFRFIRTTQATFKQGEECEREDIFTFVFYPEDGKVAEGHKLELKDIKSLVYALQEFIVKGRLQ